MGFIAALIGAKKQADAAKSAAASQERMGLADIAFQKETRDLIRNDLAVYRNGGVRSQKALDFELGLRDRPVFADGTEYGGYTKTPGYDFRMQTGMDALQSSAAARGGLYSGAALRDSQKFGQDYGSNEYGNYLARLGGRADTGMSAAQMTGASAQQTAGNVSNAYGDIGNAQAAGAIGAGNAFAGGLQNIAGLWNYQKNMSAAGGGSAGNSNFFNGLFGGGGLGGFS